MATVESEEEDESENEQQQRQEQDETLKEQQQQKEAKEENAAETSNDAAAVVEVNGSGEANNNEEEEDLESLVKPFRKAQLQALVNQVIKKDSNLVYKLFGVKLEEEEYVDLQDERVEKFLEPFTKEDLQDLVMEAADPSYLTQVADVNPAHMKILVQVHGFRWDATAETITCVFGKYGEISEIKVCKHVTDILQDYAFILFKHRSGARKALKQPLKKIGNRWAVCKLASSAACDVSWPLHFFNSLEHSKKALEALHKVVDGPKGYQAEHGLNLVPEECFDPAQRKDMYTFRELQLQSLLRWLGGGGCTKNQQDMPQIHVTTYCNQAAMTYWNHPGMQQPIGTIRGCNRDTSILKWDRAMVLDLNLLLPLLTRVIRLCFCQSMLLLLPVSLP